MTQPHKIFISYAHIDNEVMGAGQQGWITAFHKALEVRLAQLMGRRPEIWRDQKLQGNDIFGDEIVDQFPEVAALISIMSPRYLTSEWCIRELDRFIDAAEQHGGLRLGNKSRIFKVIKTQVSIESHPERVRDLLGYEFFRVDPQTGRARELAQQADPELERLYWARLEDLAYDLAQLMEAMDTNAPTATASPPDGEIRTVYLANASYDLREERNAVKRELLEHGYRVVPEKASPLFIDELDQAVSEELAQADLSVHFLGRYYGVVPEGATQSVVALEAEKAVAIGHEKGFQRLVWAPPDLEVEDDRQLALKDYLYTDDSFQEGADIIEAPLEELKAAIMEKLAPKKKRAEPGDDGDAEDLVRIYIVCDQIDLEGAEALDDILYEKGYEVILPVFDGDEAEIHEEHLENLRTCEAVVIYFGNAGELWLRAKLRELQKIAGYGRTKPLEIKAIVVGAPANRKKERLRTREAMVIQCADGVSEDRLAAFLDKLRQGVSHD